MSGDVPIMSLSSHSHVRAREAECMDAYKDPSSAVNFTELKKIVVVCDALNDMARSAPVCDPC